MLPADLTDKDQAMTWFDAEAPVLLALIAYADANQFDAHAWQIPWALGPFFNRRGRWQDYTATQQTALAAATRLGDTLALAHAHHLLGHVQSQTGAYADADPNFRRATDLFRELGDAPTRPCAQRPGRHVEKQVARRGAGRRAGRAADVQSGRALVDEATLENGVGWLYAHLGQYDRALTHCQRALSLHRDSGHRGGTADTLDSLGFVYLHLGDIAQAKAHYTRAIEAYREIGTPFGEGNSLGVGSATPC